MKKGGVGGGAFSFSLVVVVVVVEDHFLFNFANKTLADVEL